MLHNMFHGNRSTCLRDFLRVFTIYRCGGYLSHVTQMSHTNFCSPLPRRAHIKFGFDWQTVLGDLRIVNRRHSITYIRKLEHGYTISSPGRSAAQVS